jgi:hypothetical protein
LPWRRAVTLTVAIAITLTLTIAVTIALTLAVTIALTLAVAFALTLAVAFALVAALAVLLAAGVGLASAIAAFIAQRRIRGGAAQWSAQRMVRAQYHKRAQEHGYNEQRNTQAGN